MSSNYGPHITTQRDGTVAPPRV